LFIVLKKYFLIRHNEERLSNSFTVYLRVWPNFNLAGDGIR